MILAMNSFPLLLSGNACFLFVFLDNSYVDSYFWRMVSRYFEFSFLDYDEFYQKTVLLNT